MGRVACVGKRRSANSVWVGKPQGKRPLGGCRLRWEGNIKIDLEEVGCGVGTGLI